MIDISPLTSLRSDLDLPREDVKERDVKEEYRLTGPFPIEVLQYVSVDRLEVLADTFGGAVSLRIPSNDLCPALIDDGNVHENSEDWVDRLRGGDSLSLELVIRKEKLKQKIDTSCISGSIEIYLFGWGLKESLNRSITSLDKKIFVEPDEEYNLIVANERILLSGPVVTIVGQKNLTEINKESDRVDKKYEKRLKSYRRARDDINWIDFNLENVTPLHFLCANKIDEESEFTKSVRRILCSHLFQAGILYTANRSEQVGEGGFLSTYESSEHTVTLHIGPKCEEPPDAEHLVRFVRWPFVGEHSDRLMILQNAISRSIRGGDEHEAVTLLSDELADVLQEARWHFRSLIDERIDHHFDRVERATSFANNVAREIEQRISSMTKGLTNALLGAIGVVLGALLGTLVKGNADDVILKYAMISYSVYLTLFHCTYRMLSVYDGFTILKKDTVNQKEDFSGRISKKRFENIFGPLDDRINQFKKWFRITVSIYILASIFLLIGAFYVPEFILGTS